MSSYAVEPFNVWVNPLFVVRDWLASNLTGVNVRTETDSTFATSNPSPSMTLPLVLVESVTGGGLDPDLVTNESTIDVSCFAATQVDAWGLYNRANGWMVRIIGQPTQFGTVDDLTVANGAGLVNYNNPNVRRVIASYRLATRAVSVTD